MAEPTRTNGLSVDQLDLPEEFWKLNREDPAFLKALPGLLAGLAARWSVTVGPHFPEIRFNFVAPATRADGTACVLKVSRHVGETANEIAALRLWDGDGAARLLAAEPEIGALLLERLEPGTMLTEVAERDDDEATVISANALRRLWRVAPAESGLRSLESWCGAYDRNRATILRGESGFPVDLFRRADALRRDLLASTPEETVLHGDMHHFNMLRAQRAGFAGSGRLAEWLAIDPKGLAGDRCFDVCQFLRNPLPGPIPAAVNRRRLDIFCAELDMDRARTTDWCFVHAVLDACWDFEDGNSWQRAVAYAEETLTY